MEVNNHIFFVPGTPPSANHYWKRRGHVYFISARGQEYKETFGHYVPKLKEKISDPVEVTINYVRPDRRRRDVDNIAKPILDCLEDYLFEDDRWVYRLVLDKTMTPSKEGAGVEITIAPLYIEIE